MAIVEYLVGRGVPAGVQDGEALLWAAEEGHMAIVEYLVGLDVPAGV